MTTNGKIRRSWRNYLLEPEIQFRRAYYFVAFFFCMMAGAVFCVYFQLMVAVELLDAEGGLIAVRIAELFESLSWITIAAYLFSGFAAAVLFGVYSSHRVIGPSVAVRKHIEKLKAGDYSSTCHIRNGDELVTVTREINELTEVLRQKYGKS